MRRCPPFCLSLFLLTGGSLAAQQKVEFVFTGNLLGDRVWPRTGETWLGLYRTAPGFRLALTTIKVERVPDACADSATRISAGGPVVPYLLVRGHAGFKAGPVDTAFAGNAFLYSAQSISVKIGKPERWYSLQALGGTGKRRGETFIRNYTIELHSAEAPGRGLQQALCPFPVVGRVPPEPPPSRGKLRRARLLISDGSS